MDDENWMYTSGARSTMARLEKMTASSTMVVAQRRLQNIAYPTTGVEPKRPVNSTVTAGWICCALGLTCAWIFPPANVFFTAAFVLSIVAMSTHQVRLGAILMIVTSISAVACVLVCLSLATASILGIFRGAQAKLPVFVPPASQPITAASNRALFAPSTRQYSFSRPVANAPLTYDELAMMLRTGFDDDEVIAAVRQKQLVDSIDGPRMNYLRSLGAGEKLATYLRGRGVFVAPVQSNPPNRNIYVPTPVPAPVFRQNVPVASEGNIGASAVSYQEKDRQVADLKSRIDALDEDVRRVRANPKDSRYWWHYYGNYNGIDQQALDAYLKTLDQQRNDLRREKWRLEGR